MVHFTWGNETPGIDPSLTASADPGLIPIVASDLPIAGPDVLTVGAGEMFSTLASATAHAPDGSIILVDAGTYTNDFATVTTKITIEAVGGMANFIATEAPPNEKGILTVDNDVTVENCGFSGCTISDEDGGNGAGIRYEGGQMILENDSFENNQDGILGAPVIAGLTNTVSVDHCLFENNGSGTGYTHNFYMGAVSKVTFTDNVSEGANVGHEFKSRAYANDIENNVFADGPTGDASYEIDLPNGGADTVSGNLIEKGPNAQNQTFVHFGGEGIPYANSALLVSGNVFENDYGQGAVAVLNQTALTANITGNEFDGIASSNIAAGPATETSNLDGQGDAIADQTLSGVLPGDTLVITDDQAHAITMDGTYDAIEGGSGLLTVTAIAGHVVAIGGSGGLDFTEVGYSGGNTITTSANSSNALSLGGQDLVDSQGTDTIECGAGNVTGQITGTAQILDGSGNNQWSVLGTATITGEGGNPVVTVGVNAYASIGGSVGFLSVTDYGGDFAFNVAQGGTTDAVSEIGGAANVQVYDGVSHVTTSGGPSGAVLDLTTGDAQVMSVGSDLIYAGAGDDSVIVEGAATVYAGSGSLSIYGRSDTAGAVVYGDGGTYLIGGDTGDITYYGGDQASTVEAQVSRIALIGGSGALSVLGGSDDFIQGGSGGLVFDSADSGGSDTISTSAGAWDVLTLSGADLVSSYGNDLINAGSGNQTISVFGDSTVEGSSGSSRLSFSGEDTLNGVGYDQCTVSGGGHLSVTAGLLTTVTVADATVAISDQGSASATLTGSGYVTGGTWAGAGIDVATSAGEASAVSLGGGPDTVDAYGADTVTCGSGQATVVLSADGSSVIGGDGKLNVYDYDWNGSDSHTIQAGAGDVSFSQGPGLLNFIGGSGNASIDGGWGSLSVTGGSGNLDIWGGNEGATIVAGSGDLTARLSAAGGIVQFGSGNAAIQGAGWGGGNDYIFQAGLGGGNDVITGFQQGVDTLSFDGVSVVSEDVGSTSTALFLSDGTNVLLAGFADAQHIF